MSSWVSWQYCSSKSYSNLDYAFIRLPTYHMLGYRLLHVSSSLPCQIGWTRILLSSVLGALYVPIVVLQAVLLYSWTALFSFPWCVWWCPNTLWVLLCTFWVVPKHFLMLLKHTLGLVMHILSGARTHLGAVQTRFRSCYAHFGLVMGTTNITSPKMCITYNMGPKVCLCKRWIGARSDKENKENAVLLYCLHI